MQYFSDHTIKPSTLFLDSLFVLLNVSNPYTIIPYLLFTSNSGINSAIIAILTLFYIKVRFGKNFEYPSELLLTIFVIIHLFNFSVNYARGTLSIGAIIVLFPCFFFYLLLYNLYVSYRKEYDVSHSIRYVLTGYIWLCLYQLIIVGIMMLLTEGLNLFNPLINDISSRYEIFMDNVEMGQGNVSYYFPFNITVYHYDTFERLPFLHDYGIILGVFHEPHTMTYYVTPFIFITGWLYSRRTQIILFVLFLFYVLDAASTTNILCLSATLLFLLCIRHKKLAPVFIILALILATSLYASDNPIIELIKYKLDSGSNEYSQSTLKFAFSPSTFLGSNFLDKSYVTALKSEADVGIVIFLLNLLFLMILILRTLKLCLSSNKQFCLIGMFSFYFLLHSSKLALATYTLEILLLVVFIASTCCSEIKLNKDACSLS